MKYTIKSIPTKPASIALTMALTFFSHNSLAAQESEVVQETEIAEPDTTVQKESSEDVIKRITNLGTGVHEVKNDEDGKLRSLKVVGQARISTVLGKTKGIQIAQQRAKLSAQKELIVWFKTNIASVEGKGDETIFTLIGKGKEKKEEGENTENTADLVTSKAANLISGLSLVARNVESFDDANPDDETLSLVYIWSPKRAAQAEEAAQKNNANDQSTKKPTSAPDKVAKPSRIIVSPDFDE